MKILFLLVVLFAQSNGLLADVVTLRNGDRLSGRVDGLAAGKLVLVTDYAGKIQLDWKKVASLSTAERVLVEFVSGKTGIGVVRSPKSEFIGIDTMPDFTAPLSEVAAIKPDPALGEKPGLLHRWRGNIDFGYAMRAGNTSLNNFTLNFEPRRRTESNEIQLKLQSLRSTQNNLVSSRLYRGRIRYDHFLGPRGFVFVVGQMEKDEKKLLELRTSQGGGFGLRLHPGNETRISIFGGATFLQEDFQHEVPNLGSEALAGLELETRSLSPFVISVKSQMVPILSDDRHRWECDANIRVPILQGLALGLQLFNYYDSKPPKPGIGKNDFGVVSTLGLSF